MRVPLNDLHRAASAPATLLQAAFERVQRSGWYVLGPEVSAFEQEFADYCGVPHCVGVASGSDALELALRAVGIGPGDEVVGVANAAMYATLATLAIGAVPVFADIDPESLTLDPAALERAITPRTRAVVVTHLYGRLASIEALAALARARGVALIEDCAQAHGARTARGRAGSFGDLGCFSFYPTKNLGALGDGGAITARDGALAARVRSLRQYGWDAKYHVRLAGGRNSRLDELQAALLRARLPQLDRDNERRRAIVGRYAAKIEHPAIAVQPAAGAESVAHLAVVRSPRRDELRAFLSERGVDSDVHYPLPDHRQPILAGRMASVRLPVTERACAEVLSLPCFPALTDPEVEHVVASCNAWPR